MTGLAVGVTSMNAPIYISELVPTEFRGRFVAWYTFLVVLGQLVANISFLALGNRYVICISVGLLFAILQVFGVYFFMPESPRWLAKNSQIVAANKCLDMIYKP